MTLNEIRIETLKKGITMTKLSEMIEVERRKMYLKIEKNDEDTITKIKKVLGI